MLPAPTDRAHGQEARGQLGGAERAMASQLGQRHGADVRPIDSENGPGVRVHLHHMIVRAAILVGVDDRPPSRGEREAAVTTGEVPEVRHG